jgi:ribose transport system substrate-binding protein
MRTSFIVAIEANKDFYPDQSNNFFVGNSFPTCGINFTAQEIMGQTKENQ